MGTALVIGLLVVMCGGIAYVGDLLGRRMGKRRLSLFGLRPRHTAVVFTVCTGMLIAAVTLGVLMWASRDVRIAVTRGEQLLYDNHRLKQERRILDAVHRRLITQEETLEKTNTVLSERDATLRGEERRLRTETDRLQQHNQTLQEKNLTLAGRSERLEARNAGLLEANQTLTARNASVASENGRLAQANKNLAATNRGLFAANTHLKDRNRGLQTEKAGLEQARDRAQTQLTKLQGDLIGTRNDLTRAQNELASATRILTAQYASSERGQELATGTVVVRTGEELARRVIPAGASTEVVQGILQGLLEDADREIARRAGQTPGHVQYKTGIKYGLASGDNRSGLTSSNNRVRLDPHGEPSDQLAEQTVQTLMTESHPIEDQIPAGPMPEIHPLVIHALASRNATAESTDAVDVDVVGQVNRLAFRRGEEVASLPLNTASTAGQLLERLVAFLQHQVPGEAAKRSLLPDASGSVTPIDYESLLDVVARVKRMPGWVQVGAVAAADTWTAGPLRLDFYVVPATAPTKTRVATDQKPG